MKIYLKKPNKMKTNHHTILFAFVLSMYFITAPAQTKRDSLQNQTVTVVKSYTPTVRDADKISVNPSLGQGENFEKIPQSYSTLDVEAVSTYIAEKGKLVRPSVSNKNLENIPGYVELAVGNEKAFRLKSFYDVSLEDDWKAGGIISFFSLGSTTFDTLRLNSFTDFDTEVFARRKTDASHWFLNANYSARHSAYRDTLTPFGTLKTAFTNHHPGLHLGAEFYDSFLRKTDFKYRFLSSFTAHEHDLDLNAEFVFPVAGFDITTGFTTAWVNGNAATGYSNFQAGIFPAFRYERERFLFKLGFKLFYQNRTDINDAILFYPDISVEYNMVPELLTLYLSYEGRVKTVSYDEMLKNNRYIATVTELKPTSTPYHLNGGFKGSIGTRMNFNLSLGMAQEKNRPFLVTDKRAEGIILKPVYDDLNYFYFKTHLSYVANRNFETKLKFDYYQYSPETLQKAWNLEDYKVSWLMRMNIAKFDLRTDLYYIGPRYDLWNNTVVKTGETVDLNLKAGYHLLQGLYIYVEGNNLLNRKDLIYYNYPAHGLHILAGVSYSFK